MSQMTVVSHCYSTPPWREMVDLPQIAKPCGSGEGISKKNLFPPKKDCVMFGC